MNPKQSELLNIIKNLQIPYEEKYSAVEEIAMHVAWRKIEADDISQVYQTVVEFWRSLGLNEIDRDDEGLFEIRNKMANVCLGLSRQLPKGQKFFKYYPIVNKAEGFDDRVRNKMIVGAFKTGYGSSLYEFHWEYPIEGIGIKKDLISVIIDENERIPMLEWCKLYDIIVFCNRCGLDITYEVSQDCPFAKKRYAGKNNRLNKASAHYLRGKSYFRQGKIIESVKEFKIAIHTKQDYAPLHFNLGLAYKKLDRSTAEAKYHFKRALELGYERARHFLDNLE